MLVCGRDDWQSNEYMTAVLERIWKRQDMMVEWEDPAGGWIYVLRLLERRIGRIPKWMRKLDLKLVQVGFGVFHWGYFGYLSIRSKTFAHRCRTLKKRILALGENKEIIILAFSAGARAASLVADGSSVSRIICLGYPFRNPHKGIEPERYLHLAEIKTPILIIQGKRDEYGGLDVSERYTFSDSVDLLFVDTDHSFAMDAANWERVIFKIEGVLDNRINLENHVHP
jgi:hypothetical protein